MSEAPSFQLDQSIPSSNFKNLDDNTPIAAITEAEFRKYFLPFYITPNPPMDAVTVMVNRYFSMAGSPYTPLHVYHSVAHNVFGDREGLGEALFIVPPLYNSDVDRLNSFGKQHLTKIIAEMNLCMDSKNPQEAQRLSLQLANAVDEKPQVNPLHVEQWKIIYKYYNVEPAVNTEDGKVPIVGTNKHAKPSETDCELTYEDF